ncbi:MAG: hypothetical protein PHD81_02390 [Candidatus Nanoarchaeia archaeon]|nr:hypothetical protein [Candidatus Nanoarchaeia archaeon]MDD5587935.1 hypothetical protein [Candidatus Nanoarchaeia archaeon]
MKKNIFLLSLIFLLLSGIVFADSFPIYVKPLSGGSVQPSTAFDYRFDFTSDQTCASVLHSVTKTITTDKYGIGFAELDISPLNNTPSYLCEYRAASGGALTLRQTHNISTGLFNRTLGKEVKYNYINITGNMTLGQQISFKLGSTIKEISNWIISTTPLGISGDLNVTGNVNVTGYVNASTVYSGGKNLSELGTYAYNQTTYALVVISTNISALNESLLKTINDNITNLNASINYNYNESNYILTITNTNFTTLNESVTKWLYNMSDGGADGSYNATYEWINTTYNKYWYNMSDGSYNISYAEGDINLQSNISAVNTSLMSYINNNITSLNNSIVANYITDFIKYWYNQTLATLTYLTESSNNLQSNISAVNTSLMSYINNNITSLNNSLIYNYNQTFTQIDNLNVTQLLNATNITTTNISIGNGIIFWNGSNLIISG